MPKPKGSALVLLAEGAEEMEAVITVDVLRRAEIAVTVAGVEGALPIRCSRGLILVPDCALDQVSEDFDVVILPGGALGTRNLATSAAVHSTLERQVARDGFVAAICAAPTVLMAYGLFRGRNMTSHPSAREALASYAVYQERDVVVDDNLITSRGPGTTFEFALQLVSLLAGRAMALSLRAQLILS